MQAAPPLRLNSAFALACSPRRAGNTDTAAQAFCKGFSSAGGRIELLHLREQRLLPCVGCDACARFAPAHAAGADNAGGAVPAGQAARICPLAAQDDSTGLFTRLFTAQALFLAAPIYFYHLPAMLKGFIDRGQAFWMLQSHQDPVINSLPCRPAWLILVGGRPGGERLFEGSLLTIKYFCKIFNLELQDPLLLPGFDGPADLAGALPALDHIAQYGSRAARSMRA